ncbi:hypothetical protein [Methanosarcina sp. UBA5]|nr:hypothetical protein [Methanosarcina sp. UBA5]
MKRSLVRDFLQERNPGNGPLRKGELKGEKRGEKGLNAICSGGVFR